MVRAGRFALPRSEEQCLLGTPCLLFQPRAGMWCRGRGSHPHARRLAGLGRDRLLVPSPRQSGAAPRNPTWSREVQALCHSGRPAQRRWQERSDLHAHRPGWSRQDFCCPTLLWNAPRELHSHSELRRFASCLLNEGHEMERRTGFAPVPPAWKAGTLLLRERRGASGGNCTHIILRS